MLQRIRENITRQQKGLIVLHTLLEEEFTHLTGHDPKAVTGSEFAIQELLRQLAAERLFLKNMVTAAVPEASSMSELIATLDPEQAAEFNEIMEIVDGLEQRCAIQADKNAQLAFALAGQSQKLLEYMHNKIKPKATNTYARNGRMPGGTKPEAALFRGRS